MERMRVVTDTFSEGALQLVRTITTWSEKKEAVYYVLRRTPQEHYARSEEIYFTPAELEALDCLLLKEANHLRKEADHAAQ